MIGFHYVDDLPEQGALKLDQPGAKTETSVGQKVAVKSGDKQTAGAAIGKMLNARSNGRTNEL